MLSLPRRAGLWLALASLALPGCSLADPSALWRIVHNQCVPSYEKGEGGKPCAAVNLKDGEQNGYIVLKDLKGALQYLLIPTARVSGIESPVLLQKDAPDYWGAAWAARGFMDAKNGAPLPREDVSLTINSPFGRSQNQLHIHISCIRPELKTQLDGSKNGLDGSWKALPDGINGHDYLASRVNGADLAGVMPFKLLADNVADAGRNMGDWTLAAVPTRFGDGQDGFVLLASQASLLKGNRASSEDDVQDHDCAVLKK